MECCVHPSCGNLPFHIHICCWYSHHVVVRAPSVPLKEIIFSRVTLSFVLACLHMHRRRPSFLFSLGFGANIPSIICFVLKDFISLQRYIRAAYSNRNGGIEMYSSLFPCQINTSVRAVHQAHHLPLHSAHCARAFATTSASQTAMNHTLAMLVLSGR